MLCAAAGLSMVSLVSLDPLSAQPGPAEQRASIPAVSDVPARAAWLVGQMTLEEKAGQIKHQAPAIPRLGIPAYDWWSEGLHGVARAGEATVFPQAIGLAATFDTPLVHRVADTIATEFRAKYVVTRGADGSSGQYRGLTVWSPNVNIFRDPRWGRGQETFGEDPYLTSRFGVAFIKGLQGEDPARPKTVAVVKHFAVHSGPEANRHRENVTPSPHDLEDTYLPAFKAAVQEARVEGVMCAYNAIDGIPACATPMLNGLVRKDWGFTGHVVSDCAAIADFFKEDAHRYSRTPEEAAAAAIKGGTDLFCAEFGLNKSSDAQVIVRAVRQGLLSEAALDRAVIRLMEVRLRLGILADAPASPHAAIPPGANDTPQHAALALETARASLVLLKNDGLLPLKRAPRKIAVIGPNADSVDSLVGNYNGTPSAPVTLLAGLKSRFPDTRISFIEGTGHVGAPLKPVPADVLCIDAACSMRGVKVEEFAGTALSGKPVRIGTDSEIKFSWGRPTRQDRSSSLRWTGFITPQETGPYRFKLNGEGGYRIFVDGKEVVNAWDAAEPAMIADGEIRLDAGKRYAIRVEAIQSGNRGDHRLIWSNFSQREDAAIASTTDADLIIFAGGLTARLEGEEMRVAADGFAGGDRTSLDLPAPQQQLLERLHATGKPVVLVLMNGSAMGVNWADKNLPAVVEAWYPGGVGGRAIAELIAGDFSPSGRLPLTFYKSVAQLPDFGDYSMANRTYRYFTGTPLYPFGHGLSYTRFAYAAPRVSGPVRAGHPVDVSVEVANRGERDGHEVVQLYVTRPGPGAPLKSLAGFQRVFLKRGETRRLRFTLAPEAFSVVTPEGTREVASGAAVLWIGGGQPSPAVSGQTLRLTVAGRARLRPTGPARPAPR
jgi:beta-glucosidase